MEDGKKAFSASLLCWNVVEILDTVPCHDKKVLSVKRDDDDDFHTHDEMG